MSIKDREDKDNDKEENVDNNDKEAKVGNKKTR